MAERVYLADKATLDSIYNVIGEGVSCIKSIQRGAITLKASTGTVTINAVDINKSVVLGSSYGIDDSTYGNDEGYLHSPIAIELTNSNTVTVHRYLSSSEQVHHVIYYQVIEFN